MIIALPYNTDAPIHRWPIATAGLMIANLIIFTFFGPHLATGAIARPWVLEFGTGLHPVQWIASPFMHENIIHLILNLFFLWPFGIVVEGKIGWFRFLMIYCLIAIGGSFLVQLVMLPFPFLAGSVGASTAIYGIMAIAAIWAPVNNISCWYSIVIFYMGVVDIPVFGVAGFYIGLDVIFAVLTMNVVSFLHLAGVIIGLPIGYLMLKNKRVDCEGWDIFTVNKRNAPGAAKRKKEENKRIAEKADKTREESQQKVAMQASEQIHELLLQGNGLTAYKLYDRLSSQLEEIPLRSKDYVLMIKLLHADRLYEESVPFMVKLIEAEPQATDKTRISLAHICIARLDRPAYALELLEQVNKSKLSEEKLDFMKKLAAKAEQMQTDGVVEVDGPLVS